MAALPAGFIGDDPSSMAINWDFVRGSHVMIATPCYGGQLTDQYFVSMLELKELLLRHGVTSTVVTIRNESLVPRARNSLVKTFRDYEDFTHLMFIDADIQFKAIDWVRLLCMDEDVIAGTYAMKGLDWDKIRDAALRGEKDLPKFGARNAINVKIDPETQMIRTKLSLIEVLDAPTGFLLIKRAVIDKMVDAYPETRYRNDDVGNDDYGDDSFYALFDCIIDEGRYLSEDYTFCRRWQKIGGDIWVDMDVELNHIGSFTYEGNPRNIFKSEDA